MRNRSGGGWFPLFCALLALTALGLVGSNVAVIAVRGFHSLPACLTQPEVRFALGLSVKSACISTALCFLLAIPTAYTLTRSVFPGRRAAEIVLELTMSLPYIVLGLSMLILFSSPAGKWLKEAGFPVVFHQNGVILAQLIVNLPFAVRLCSAAFQGADRKLECVAGLLGASPAQQFLTVLLPLSRNALISAVILVWSRALGEFGATLMLVGVTRMKTETLPGSIYLAVSTNNLDAALASAFLLLVISALSLTAANLLGRTGKQRSRYV
ncbi:ABC transporter permease subunit [Pseudoflavonifractor sp. AF19-9AC]|uniref:molybdate ABC transporter permease subunit n=1 Tax=Pseudoflavonifractor sp. AF19-9AC TaxID=2292244 RepID=UPI000E4A13FC|nr:ABC transporter permease subunit [Pseudoflavonifractor sp. AF19-9AC]RHR06811.1 ABC transporter permease subunit [Pseudoflavonifractor sp. AF19-9AC]